MSEESPITAVRIDKWLWAARMFKTRSAASTACTAGHVKMDGESVKPSKTVKPGDRVDVVTPGGLRNLEERARRHNGEVSVTPLDDGGTRLRWWAPLP